jgi:glutaredoxin
LEIYIEREKYPRMYEIAYRPTCEYSARALRELYAAVPRTQVRAVQIPDDEDSYVRFQKRMCEATGGVSKRYTFPQIFRDGVPLGGCRELLVHLAAQK